MQIVSLTILILLSASTYGQTKIINGMVIEDLSLEKIPLITIQYSDTSVGVKTDLNGEFTIEIPVSVQTLFISGVGFESTTINFKDDCERLEIILLARGTYDFKTPKQVDKIRTKRLKKLPELHLTAYKKRIFKTQDACYEELLWDFFHKKYLSIR